MKREQLLEAIGGVEESLLIESEKTARRPRMGVGRVALIAAVVAALAITVMASTGVITGFLRAEENGSTVSNLSTGMGTFVYSDDAIYYGAPGYIYKYDVNGKLLKTYPLSDRYETPVYMFATEDAIVYVNVMGVTVEPEDENDPGRAYNWGLRIQPKDGTAPQTVYPEISATNAYVDGTMLYNTNGGEMLTRIDLQTMQKEELLENVSQYFVDDTYIYAVQEGKGKCYFRSLKDEISFEKISLKFDPNKVIADGDTLYICQWIEEDDREEGQLPYQVNQVQNGVTTPLPIYTWFYQVLDGCILYRDDNYKLKSYDLDTGKTETLQKNVFDFSVVGGRYVCIERFNKAPVLLDWTTGETVKLPSNK